MLDTDCLLAPQVLGQELNVRIVLTTVVRLHVIPTKRSHNLDTPRCDVWEKSVMWRSRVGEWLS